jgi:hypothetical protein
MTPKLLKSKGNNKGKKANEKNNYKLINFYFREKDIFALLVALLFR